MSTDSVRMTADELAQKKREREELLARLRDVAEQRDKLLSQYEAMALQLDDSVREVDDAQLEARRNASKAEECELLERQEATQIAELSRQLDEERGKTAEVAAELVRYRDSVAQKLAEHARSEDPWNLLACAISQILSDWVAWLRAKIPPESALLPWFDRAVELANAVVRLASKCAQTLFEWAKPRACELWKRLKGEVGQRMSKE